jgi:hypothetical protein
VDKKHSNDPTKNGAYVYFGNYLANGDLYQVTTGLTGGWLSAKVQAFANAAGLRVRGVAWSDRRQMQKSPVLYVAYGSHIQVLDAATTTPTFITDVDLNLQQDTVGFMPDTGENKVIDILSISTDSYYGDLYIDARDATAGNHIETLVMNPIDFSVRNLYDVSTDLGNCGTCFMPWREQSTLFRTDEGRVSGQGGGVLERMVPVFQGAPSAFYDLSLVP